MISNTILLVDGSNQAYRAFFAMNSNLRSPTGQPTNAIYGLVRILLKIVNDIKPVGAMVVFDTGRNFREDLYPDYKGHRPDMPEDLRLQWPLFLPLCECLGIPAYCEDDGFEADDVIGTLALRFASEGYDVSIVSNDKDFAQLVNDKISLYNPIKDVVMNTEAVFEKYGVGPEKIIDMLTLSGDASDNIPGVEGVREKTAVKLLNSYQTWQGLIDNVDKIKGKMQQKVQNAIEQLPLYAQLVTIRTDVPLEIGVEDLRLTGIKGQACLDLFLDLGFKKLVKDLDLEQYLEGLDQSGYELISTSERLTAILEELRTAPYVSVDLETTSLDTQQAKIVGVSLCGSSKKAYYVPVSHLVGDNCPDAMTLLGPFLADSAIPKVGQNLKYDLKVLKHNGFLLEGIVGDSMLRDYVKSPDQKHNLDRLALRYLRHNCVSYESVTKHVDGRFELLSPTEALIYAAEDAHVAFLLQAAIELEPKPQKLYEEIEIPILSIIAEMEMAGIQVDAERLIAHASDLGRQISSLEQQIYQEVGRTFNINSTKQVAQILFEERAHTPIKKTKSGYSTGVDVLQALTKKSSDPLPKLILDYRELAKLKSTYLDPLPEHIASDNRIRTSFHQALTETGRLSSSDPNLQNIPIKTETGRKVRDCFVAPEGYRLISADYSQIELRILAHFCQTGGLIEAFQSGIDVHQLTGEQIAGGRLFYTEDHRRVAKAINYGLMYGMSAFRLSKELDIGVRDAAAYIENYFERYPQVKQYMSTAIEKATEVGYSETLMGRRRPIFGLKAKNKIEREAAQRLAMNSPIQGTAADIMKVGMIRVQAALKADNLPARILLQVHDELVVEAQSDVVDRVAQILERELTQAAQLRVPLEVNVGIGQTWNDIH